MIRVNQLKLPIDHTKDDMIRKVVKTLKIKKEQLQDIRIIRQSLDARKKPDLYYVYSVDCQVNNEKQVVKKAGNHNVTLINPVIYKFPSTGTQPLLHRPVIVGLGPAGLFCGYMLAKAGYRPLIFERGEAVEKRQKTVDQFWKNGILDPESNVQFGEGGAGTFSDGKLNTLVKDREGRGRKVMEVFHAMGAPEEIIYQQKPHLGTDVLVQIVRNMRAEIEKYGGEVHFSSKVTDIQVKQGCIAGITVNETDYYPCNVVVLAPGHSARDTFMMLYQKGIMMEAKSFAVGVRVEHKQEMINLSQYGSSSVPSLGAASYKVTHTAQNGRGVYSFCMCPGGYVVNASSEEGMLAVNGMSYQKRDSANANSALIVTVTPEDYSSFGNSDTPLPLKGIEFQRVLEKKAFEAGKGFIPVQLFKDYKEHRASTAFGSIWPCMKGSCRLSNVREIFPSYVGDAIEEGVTAFGKNIKGFDSDDALLSGVESRSSSPVRIVREDSMEAKIKGFYPCGEGAGYAGGITSAAIDGIKTAEAIAKKYVKLS